MDSMIRYAAIDIGSNAVRLLLSIVCEVEGTFRQKKISWVRMPVRLGEDAFLRNEISEQRIIQLEKTMTGFKHLIDAYDPLAFRACATSAMRTAANGKSVCQRIAKKTGIQIQIIDGEEEARYIFQNKHKIMSSGKKGVLFIDVGGGSTEMTLFCNGKLLVSRSFNIGTIRLLNNRVKQEHWEEMEDWLRKETIHFPDIEAIGSGGNINKLFKMAKGRPGDFVEKEKIEKIQKKLATLNFEERIYKYRMKPDRADVIVPGGSIYLKAMGWAGCERIYVPMQGLADGIVSILHSEQWGLNKI